MFADIAPRVPRVASAAAAAALATATVGLVTFAGSAIPNMVAVQTLTFYAVTAGGYAALPFVRRGDVLMVAMWLVLAAGVAPCIVGQEISAQRMFADMAGVLLAATPIYIARLRQVAQGDTRAHRRRRQSERDSDQA